MRLSLVILSLLQTTLALPADRHNQLASTRLSDLFISVKTTGGYHQSRLVPVLDTWYTQAPDSTWIFTDSGGEELSVVPGHLVTTSCPSDHSRQSLCCKMEAEIKTFLETTDRQWFCHVDDDNYLNVPALLKQLSRFPADQDWYLGKVSISEPLEIYDKIQEKDVRFYFGTGGAGFCLSRPVAERISQLSHSLSQTGNIIGLPDDVTVGYITTVLLQVPLVQLDQFHSHLESLRRIETSEVADQITLSYGRYEDGRENVVSLSDLDTSRDPTTFYTIHCLLFSECHQPR